MKKDNSANNFNYAGFSIDRIINNPDEYIVPECQEACKKFWDMNIFTVACSNRRETINKDGSIRKYIMLGNLSDENKKIFEDLIESNLEWIVTKMYELSISKEFYTLSKNFEYNNYNLIYELIQNSFRSIKASCQEAGTVKYKEWIIK